MAKTSKAQQIISEQSNNTPQPLSPQQIARLEYNRSYINSADYKLECWLNQYSIGLMQLSARDYMGNGYGR